MKGNKVTHCNRIVTIAKLKDLILFNLVTYNMIGDLENLLCRCSFGRSNGEISCNLKPVSLSLFFFSISLDLFLFVSLSLDLSVYMSIYLTNYLSSCLSIYLSIYKSIYLSIGLYQSTYLSLPPSPPSLRLPLTHAHALSNYISCLSLSFSLSLYHMH